MLVTIKFDILNDEDLQVVLNKFISAMLPHSSYCAKFFTQNLEIITQYIHLNEFTMEYRVMLEALTNLNKIKYSFDEFTPNLTKETFSSLVTVNITDIVTKPDYGMKEWLAYEGYDNNLAIQTVKEMACQKLFERSMELYDTCYALCIDSVDVLNFKPEFRDALIAHISLQGVNTQISILQSNVYVGRKVLSGYDDWIKYTSEMLIELKDRLNDTMDSTFVVDSVSSSKAALKELAQFNIPIAQYGIPQIDDETPILRHRLVVVVGAENIGKTKFLVDNCVNVLLEGGRAVFMCGETPTIKMYASILINYAYKRYQVILKMSHVTNPENCPEEIQKIITMCIDELAADSKLILVDSFNYGTIYDELVNLYDIHKFDACYIDHSCALVGTVGGGSVKEKIDALASETKRFRKHYPVFIMISSHPSTTSKDSLRKDEDTKDSPTKGSSNLSTDADEVFVLRDNKTLQKQNLIYFENTKRRDSGRVGTRIILRKKFEVSAFIYDEKNQAVDNTLTLEKEEAIRQIEEDSGDIFEDSIYSLD